MELIPKPPTGEPLLVAHLIHRFDVGGLEQVATELITHLPPARFRHALISLTECNPELCARLATAPVEFHSLHKREGKDWAVWWRLWRLLLRLRPAILHSCNIATLEGVLPAVLAGVPVRIHAEHGRDIYDLTGSNPVYLRLRRLLAPLVDRFVAVSDELATWLRAEVGLPHAKVSTIINGVECTRFHPRTAPDSDYPFPWGSAPGSVTIGTVGRLAAVKDQATLIRAVATLAPTHPGLRLVIAGDGPLREALSRLVRELNLSGVVWLAGSRSDIPELMRNLDLFVLSSLAEGTPLTLLEAMASGVPVVASAVGGVPALIQPEATGMLVPPRDPPALAAALDWYLRHPEARRLHGATAAAWARANRDLATTITGYEQLYCHLLLTKGVATNSPRDLQ